MSERIDIALICSECQTRNYRTTRKRDVVGATQKIEKKKYCPRCLRHTVHKETK